MTPSVWHPLSADFAELAARALAFDGHAPFSETALAQLATGARQLVWAGPAAAVYSPTEAEFVVDPEFRHQGNGGRMLNLLLTQAPGDLYLWAYGGHPDARALAASRGLQPVREVLQLRVPGAEPDGHGPGSPAPDSDEPGVYIESDDTDALRRYRSLGYREYSIDIRYRWRSEPYGV